MTAIMLQGTGSDVGKSVLTAGLCRVFANRGLTVRPFKPQNMSNNAAVTVDGGEIGRAQALQAQACRIAPSTLMNPVLLKPESDHTAQVIVRGRAKGHLHASNFIGGRAAFLPEVLTAFRTLCSQSDLVIVEGAGSPAEINLRQGDIANMGFARAANVPVVMIGDIDRGGVIASLAGTHAVLDPDDRELIKGFIVNRLRGDASIFQSGYDFIEKFTGWKGLGVLPWIDSIRELPSEDSIPEDVDCSAASRIEIAVPLMPRIANFDDLDALEGETHVKITRIRPGQPLPASAHVVFLPGSKATIADLQFFRRQGWDIDLAGHIRRGGYVFGLCGGYQMLGQTINDPDGIEGNPTTIPGLGLLEVDTVLTRDKQIYQTSGMTLSDSARFSGYEIHCGETVRSHHRVMPLIRCDDGRLDGAISPDGRIAGCYVHRLFDMTGQRAAWLDRWGARSDGLDYTARVERALETVASTMESGLDIEGLLAIAR